jgi:hypothetical protein
MVSCRWASRAAILIVVGQSLMGSGLARAYDKADADAAGWRYEIQPYASILVAITGDATVLDQSVPVDVTAGGDPFSTCPASDRLLYFDADQAHESARGAAGGRGERPDRVRQHQ